MRINRKRVMTIALIVTGLAIAALGTTMFLTAPSSWPYPGHMGSYYWQEQGQTREADRDDTQAPDADRRVFDDFVPRGYGMFRGGYYGMRGPGHLAGGAVVFLGMVILGVFIFRHRHDRNADWSNGASQHEENALAILRQEFAAGHLSEEEYRHRLEVLQE